MNLIEKIFNLFKPIGNESIKSIHIFKINGKYKVATCYKLDSGIYISSHPVTILPENVELEKLSEVIFRSLEESRMLKISEEDQFYLGTKGYLKSLKEKSFKNLYTKSSSCAVSLKNNCIVVQLYKIAYNGRGLEEDKNKCYETAFLEDNLLEMTNFIIDKLTLNEKLNHI